LIRVFASVLPLLFLIISGCAAHQPLSSDRIKQKVELLSHDLLQLHSLINPDAAALVAETAIEYSSELANIYRITGSPRQHNLLVNLGIRQRGLCFHWTDDLLQKMQSLKSEYFEFHSAVAHRNSDLREHSSVVVTFKGAAFATGIVLDGWRDSGDLYWVDINSDSYTWSLRYLKQNRKNH